MSDGTTVAPLTEKPGHPHRRSVVKGMAWSLPVVAATTVSPLAAASADQALVNTLGQGGASPSNGPTGGTVNVTFSNSGLQITNIVGAPWDAGVFTAELLIVNNFTITGVSIDGTPITSAGGSFTAGGLVWTVVDIDLASKVLALQTVGPVTVDAANGASQNFFIPTIVFTGTYTGTSFNSGRVTFDVAAANVSGGSTPGVRFGG
ncbi:MAG TPA: hypothetical protein PKE40_10590 [Arachnia sp.]|nr:hypothetical protein [Arachnia sp.]HMT86791.1 hypothetical protein [Arachnia sp.]